MKKIVVVLVAAASAFVGCLGPDSGVDSQKPLKVAVFEDNGGGKYDGVCAGAFFAMQQSREGYSRLGLIPY